MPGYKGGLKQGWPENSAHYWNHLGTKKMAEGNTSPFIGLLPISDNSEDSCTEVDATQYNYENHSFTADLEERPHAPFMDMSMNLPSPQKILKIEANHSQDSTDTIPAEEGGCNSPSQVEMYPQSDTGPTNGPNIHQFQPIVRYSVPNYAWTVPPPRLPPATAPPVPVHMFHRATMMPTSQMTMIPAGSNPGYPISYGPMPAGRAFMNTRIPHPMHPRWSGPVMGSPYLSAVPTHTYQPPYHVPNRHYVSTSSQTNSGVLPNYLRPLKGMAGHPDSRILCPICGREEWYVDIITKDNAIIPAPQPHGLLDSRLTCKYCKSDIWQAELLTDTYPYIYVPPTPLGNPEWMQCNMPNHPPNVNNPFVTPQHNNVETASPDSGVQCGLPTPDNHAHVTSGKSPSMSEGGQHGGPLNKELYANVVKISGRRLDFDSKSDSKWVSSFTRLQ